MELPWWIVLLFRSPFTAAFTHHVIDRLPFHSLEMKVETSVKSNLNGGGIHQGRAFGMVQKPIPNFKQAVSFSFFLFFVEKMKRQEQHEMLHFNLQV